MKTLLYNPIFINPQAYYVFPRLTRYLQPDNESTSEPANYIGTIEVKAIAYGDTTLKRTYTNTDSIDLSEFKNTWINVSLFTKVGSCVLGEWKIGNVESDLPYIDPEVLASLKAVVIVGNKTNNDSDRAIVKNLVDPDNPFVISNAAYTEGSGYADKGSPYYGAFVTDGIDDLITSTKTVQEMLGGSNEITVVSMIHQIEESAYNNRAYTNYINGNNGHFRNQVADTKTGIYGYTITGLNSTNASGSVVNNILGDKNDYEYDANTSVELGNAKYSVQNYIKSDGTVSSLGSQVAWYWTIIANKVLTTDQINQVIAYFNLDRTLKPDILCNTIKQGITNENHAEFGDKLIDFSGNGRDIQLNNIAWKGDSGIGKYEVDFLDSSIWNSSNSTITSSKIDCKNAISHIMLLYYSVGSKEYPDIPSFKVIKTGADIDYSYIDETGSPKSVKIVDGVNILPASHNTLYSGSGRFCGFGNPGMGNSVTITQIPSHAGGLCLDGINDFGKVTGMPVYKDYTVVTDREIFANIGAISSKNNPGAFVETAGNSVYSFGQATSGLNFISTRSISYLSKYSYCGQSITAGAAEDGTDMWLGTIRDNDSRFFNGAIYSLMSFPYSMSEFLIERQLKKHKLGTLYPDMVEFRPIVKSNVEYSDVVYLNYSNGLATINVGDYVDIGDTVAIRVVLSNTVDEVVNAKVNGQECEIVNESPKVFDCKFTITSKSPQKIDITIDEYIRYEDIVQPYPVLLRFKDESGNEVSWGGKFRVGSTVTRIGSIADAENNLLNGLYSVSGLSLNGKAVTTIISVVEKQMVFKTTATYLLGSNKPKCVLSPSRLNIPNSSYKILGYIPDLSGNGNHGILNNSAYAEGSGVNADGSYQLDGVDDFITIPTTAGGKQVLMKVNWQKEDSMIYNQNPGQDNFAIFVNDYNGSNVVKAYASRNNGNTYIDGILNSNILATALKDITHNITITNENVIDNTIIPVIGANAAHSAFFAQMSLYDFMLFDEISTDEEILNLNKYIGIEPKVTVPPYYWDAYGKANNNADDIEGTRHALWNKANLTDAGEALICNNIGYDEMSGYGGYSFKSFNTASRWNVYPSSGEVAAIEIISRNGYSITLKKKLEDVYSWRFNYGSSVKDLTEDLKFKFKCDKTIKIVWQLKYQVTDGEAYQTETLVSQEVEANTEADISLIHKTAEQLAELGAIKHYYLIYFNNAKLAIDEEYTITMLPLYPNGLVCDGVTDYIENKLLPIFTDFTLVIKALKLTDYIGSGGIIIKKGINTDFSNAEFIYGLDSASSEENRNSFWSFGGAYRTTESTPLIGYMTKTNVNGNSITPGANTGAVGLTISKREGYSKMVFYKAILYPQTITNLEIMFLKNMFEKDEIIDLTNPIFIQE